MPDCHKCGHSFNTKLKLDAHVNKRIPCVADDNSDDGFKCEFCKNTFSNKYNLNRHLETCVVRKSPDLLIKHMTSALAQKDEVINQQNILLSKQSELIEQLKDTKQNVSNTIEIGDNSQVNIDNSVTNITNNITLIEQPFSFRERDMLYLLCRTKEDGNTENEFWILAKNIRKHMKAGNLEEMINSLLTFIHNNNLLKQGQNIRYCPDGKYKGELLIYDYDDKGIGYWRPSDLRPISQILSKEFEFIHKQQNEQEQEITTIQEDKNIDVLEKESTSLHHDIENQECIVKFIKKFRMSRKVPDNIRNDLLEHYHPLNKKPSVAVKADCATRRINMHNKK